MLNAITLAPDGQTLATARLNDSTKKKNDGIQLWDLRSKKLLRTLAISGQNYALAFSKNGNMIAGSIASKTLPDKIQIWNTHNGQLIHTLKTPPHPMPYFNMGTIQFSPTENLLAVPGMLETVYLYDADTGKLQRTLHSNTQLLISDLRFSSDGKYLFMLSSDGNITRWRIR